MWIFVYLNIVITWETCWLWNWFFFSFYPSTLFC